MPEINSPDSKSITSLQARIAELESVLKEQELQNNLMIRSFFHDVKNPLAVTLGSLQVAKLVAGTNLSAKAMRLLNAAEEGSVLQLAMINNLSEQIKIDMGELTLLQERFYPGEIVAKIISKLETIELTKNFTFNDINSNLTTLGDSQVWTIIIKNVLENCVKHTIRGGRITCETFIDTHHNLWELVVSDEGEVLQPNEFEVIFDRHKIPSTKNLGARRDIGMGLSYARTAIRAMGGELKAVDNNGVGAKFILSLKMP